MHFPTPAPSRPHPRPTTPLSPTPGTTDKASSVKKGYKLPRHIMSNGDLARIINSDEIQSVVKPAAGGAVRRAPLKKNPLKNLGALLKLNPYAKVARRAEVLQSARAAGVKKGRPGAKATAKAFYSTMVTDSEYQGQDYEVFATGLGAPQE